MLDGHDRVVRFSLFLRLLHLLLPLFQLLQSRLLPLLVRCLRQDDHRIRLTDKTSRRVRHQIGQLHLQRVAVDQSRISQPVGQRVLLLVLFQQESPVVVEVQPPYLGQRVVAIGEEERKPPFVAAVGLEQETVGLRHRKCRQHHVVGEEMRIGNTSDGVDAQRVSPDSVLSDVGRSVRLYQPSAERYHLTLLTVPEVAVGILQGIGKIFARSHPSDDESPSAVGARHPEEGFGGKGRVIQVVVQPHQDTLDGFEVHGIEHRTRHLEGVDALACREAIRIVAHRIALVVVGDGIREVDGIGCILLERILQFYHDFLSCRLYFRHFQLWRRDDHLVGSILQLYVLVKIDVYLSLLHARSPFGRRGMHHSRRCIVIPSPVGLSHARTRGDGGSQRQQE